MIDREMSDAAVLKEIGVRIARYRLNKDMTQSTLAVEAGVSLPTLQRAERGASVQVLKLIRILRALNLLENVEALIPEIAASPLQQLKLKGKIRRRASSPHEADQAVDWSWGENQ
ncbi:MAG: helix-turn-helix domain-containing protein [Candidatus Omnitrophica bacterium]|nr:helix-turn-helix domain-containing protein [Candidatus Omnitrophota bacterium]